MKIRNINKVITSNGDTSDIINVVMMAYDIESDPQISELAKDLQGADIEQTCYNIWKFLIDNINYKADADGTAGELIRTPARLVHDATGDCKSYSLFTATVLRYLDIRHVFRFASYTKQKEATHVYVIAFDEHGNEIPIDAVAHVQLNANFKHEVKYTYKCDMANGKTKISYLAGLQNSGIGTLGADDDERYRVWMDDDTETGITPGKAWLYAQYDLLSEKLNITTSENEKLYLYRQISIIAAHLWAYKYVFSNTEEFDTMSYIICGMIADGRFEIYDTNKLDDWFYSILISIEEYYNTNLFPQKYDADCYNRIQNNVTSQNTISELDSIGNIKGWKPLADGLKKAGIYFLYLFIPTSELKNYPSAVTKKRNVQNTFYTLIHKIDIFHSASTVLDYFRSGIIARTGMEPEKYISEVKLKNVKTVGSFTATLLTVGTIISVILGLVELIKAIFPNSSAAKYAPSSGAADIPNELYTPKQNPKNGGGTNGGNNTGTNGGNNTGSSLLSKATDILPYAAMAIAALFFINKKK